jgi:hypothetical protein
VIPQEERIQGVLKGISYCFDSSQIIVPPFENPKKTFKKWKVDNRVQRSHNLGTKELFITLESIRSLFVKYHVHVSKLGGTLGSMAQIRWQPTKHQPLDFNRIPR